MPSSHQFDSRLRLLVESFEGPIVIDDIIALKTIERAEGIIEPGLSVVLNLRGAVVDARPADLERLAHFMRDHVKHMEGSRLAVLVEDPRTVALAMIWERHVTGFHELRSFNETDDALEWLGFTREQLGSLQIDQRT